MSITAPELRAHFGRRTLTLLEQYRLDQLRQAREAAPQPRVVTICAWCQTTPPPTAHVIYSHIMCDVCAERFERQEG